MAVVAMVVPYNGYMVMVVILLEVEGRTILRPGIQNRDYLRP